MKELLDRKIKEIITEFPAVAGVLEGYSIGCVSCSAGDCRFSEIVEVHNLPESDEQTLFTKIAGIVYPGKVVVIPKMERKTPAEKAGAKLSPPVQKLVDEHVFIKKVVAWAGNLKDTVDVIKEKDTLIEAIDFIKGYADAYHHAKEEDILFKQTDQAGDIIKVMLSDHETGRAHIRAALAAIETGDGAIVAQNLRAWSALLNEHIKKEDEILFPWIDRHLTDAQVGKLFGEFRQVEERFGVKPADYEKYASVL